MFESLEIVKFSIFTPLVVVIDKFENLFADNSVLAHKPVVSLANTSIIFPSNTIRKEIKSVELFLIIFIYYTFKR